MGPLSGIKIIDLTSMVSGPMCSMILADQGAEVIKVEPVIGDQVRHMATPHNGVNAPFYSVNRGKKSLAIDLKSKEGKEILLKLAEDADVFMQNFRPGAIDRMGFSEKVIRKLNKKIIYLSISGFGEKVLTLNHEYMIQLFKLYREQQIFKLIEILEDLKCSV